MASQGRPANFYFKSGSSNLGLPVPLHHAGSDLPLLGYYYHTTVMYRNPFKNTQNAILSPVNYYYVDAKDSLLCGHTERRFGSRDDELCDVHPNSRKRNPQFCGLTTLCMMYANCSHLGLMHSSSGEGHRQHKALKPDQVQSLPPTVSFLL